MTRSQEIYPTLSAHLHKTHMRWTFPSGATVTLGTLQYDADVMAWKSSEIPLILFDEATEFSRYQFFYMISRNRSTCGVTPYIRGYCNPDPDSYVKEILAPWVDEDWPAETRAKPGELRYFLHSNDVVHWVNAATPKAMSITFIPADVYDNTILMEKDPGYIAGLEALPEVEKQRLLYGNWSIRAGGTVFKREWFPILDTKPDDIEKVVRFWDKAATLKTERGTGPGSKTNDPDYTAGVLMGKRKAGSTPRYVVLSASWAQLDPGGVEQMIKTIATQDGKPVPIRIEQEGGSSGKQDIFNFVAYTLAGYDVGGVPSSGSKATRAAPFSAQAKIGNVGLLRGPWNVGYLNFLAGFPSPFVHDDVIDASSGAFNVLTMEPEARMRDPLADARAEAKAKVAREKEEAQKNTPALSDGSRVVTLDDLLAEERDVRTRRRGGLL